LSSALKASLSVFFPSDLLKQLGLARGQKFHQPDLKIFDPIDRHIIHTPAWAVPITATWTSTGTGLYWAA